MRSVNTGWVIAVNVLLLTGIAWYGAEIFWDWQTAQHPPALDTRTAVLPPAPDTTASPSSHRQLAQQLAQRKLFGQTPARKSTPTALPVTLNLYGILVFTGPRDGAAIIAARGSPQRYFLTGETLPDGGTLTEVHPGYVLVSRNGTRERLTLTEESGTSAAAPASSSQPKAPQPDNIVDLRNMLVRQPQRIFEYVRIEPHQVNGRLHGYRIIPQGDQPLYQRLGLKPNDVVVEINGIDLNHPQKLGAAVSQLAHSPIVRIKILRNNRREQLQMKLQ